MDEGMQPATAAELRIVNVLERLERRLADIRRQLSPSSPLYDELGEEEDALVVAVACIRAMHEELPDE